MCSCTGCIRWYGAETLSTAAGPSVSSRLRVKPNETSDTSLCEPGPGRLPMLGLRDLRDGACEDWSSELAQALDAVEGSG